MRILTDLTIAELRALARRDRRPRSAPRLYAVAHVLDGKSREEAARLCGMDRQALRDAVVRYNAEGVNGLADRPLPGRQPRLSEGEQAALAALPSAAWIPSAVGCRAGRWLICARRPIDAGIDRWNKSFHPASMSRVVRRLGFSRQKARQIHPQSDPAAQAAFAKKGCRPQSMTSRRPIRPSGSRYGFKMKPGWARKVASAIAGG